MHGDLFQKLAIWHFLPAILTIRIWSPRGMEERSKCTSMHSEGFSFERSTAWTGQTLKNLKRYWKITFKLILQE